LKQRISMSEIEEIFLEVLSWQHLRQILPTMNGRASLVRKAARLETHLPLLSSTKFDSPLIDEHSGDQLQIFGSRALTNAATVVVV